MSEEILAKKKEYFKVIPAVYLVLIKNGKILMLRRANTGFEDGNYSLPAGHLDGGETARQAMVREAVEEIGIVVKIEDLDLVHALHRDCKSHERIDLFFTAKQYGGTPTNCEPNKCDDLSWFYINNLPSNTIPYIRQVVEKVAAKEPYSEEGWDENQEN